MPRYQLVLLNSAGAAVRSLLVDNPGARRPFAYRGQTLEEGALIEVTQGEMYLVVEYTEEGGLPRFTCRALSSEEGR